MKFYQQKYFKPYKKIVASEHSPQRLLGDIRTHQEVDNYRKESGNYRQQFDNYRPKLSQDEPRMKEQKCLRDQDLDQQRFGLKQQRLGIEQHQFGLDKQQFNLDQQQFRNIREQSEADKPIWQHLYHEGIKSHKQLLQKHKENKLKIDSQCTFQPILKSNRRYMVPSHSTFLERVNVWQEHKIERIVKEKEEEINRGLKECTFTPQINVRSKKGEDRQPSSFERHKSKLSQWKNSRSRLEEDRGSGLNKSQMGREKSKSVLLSYYSPKKEVKNHMLIQTASPKKQPVTRVELDRAKRLIHTELKRINL